jgi:hypothetical protein
MSATDRPVVDLAVDREYFFRVTAPEIIDSITGGEQAQWGIMTAHHLLEHLVLPLQFVTGEFVPTLLIPEEKLERQRLFLFSEYGLPHNFKFPLLPADGLPELTTSSLADAKQRLKDHILRFLEIINSDNFSKMLHPIFGILDREGWLMFQYKHFCHHFTQFGLLSSN